MNATKDACKIITSPFINRNRDCLEVYVQQISENSYIVEDDGETIHNLEPEGITLSKGDRKQLEDILNRHGVCIDGDDVLYTYADDDDLEHKSNALIQCMLEVDTVFHTVELDYIHILMRKAYDELLRLSSDPTMLKPKPESVEAWTHIRRKMNLLHDLYNLHNMAM